MAPRYKATSKISGVHQCQRAELANDDCGTDVNGVTDDENVRYVTYINVYVRLNLSDLLVERDLMLHSSSYRAP